MQYTGVRSLGWKDPLKKEMATCSSILAWKIPWPDEPSGLQSMGLQRVGHDEARMQAELDKQADLKRGKKTAPANCDHVSLIFQEKPHSRWIFPSPFLSSSVLSLILFLYNLMIFIHILSKLQNIVHFIQNTPVTLMQPCIHILYLPVLSNLRPREVKWLTRVSKQQSGLQDGIIRICNLFLVTLLLDNVFYRRKICFTCFLRSSQSYKIWKWLLALPKMFKIVLWGLVYSGCLWTSLSFAR